MEERGRKKEEEGIRRGGEAEEGRSVLKVDSIIEEVARGARKKDKRGAPAPLSGTGRAAVSGAFLPPSRRPNLVCQLGARVSYQLSNLSTQIEAKRPILVGI